MRIQADNPLLQYCGRIDFDNPKAPVMVYACTSVKLAFTGTSVSVTMDNRHCCYDNYMGYVLDGEMGRFLLADEPGQKDYKIAGNLKDGQHELLLYKRQDAGHYVTLLGFDIDGDIIEPSERPARRIEVFGDSVSCGEVSEALDYVGKPDPVHNGEYSNSYYSYSWMTARKLNAELHDTSQGGIALLDGTGYFAAPVLAGVESCYDKIEYNPQLGETKPWDFSKYTPHVVVVAIGQNDSHPEDYMAEDYDGTKAARWRAHYETFIRRLMSLYPQARIILTTTILNHDAAWDKAIDYVCNKINNHRVHHFLYKRNGAGTPGHIRIPEAEEMSDELVAYINSLGKEIWN